MLATHIPQLVTEYVCGHSAWIGFRAQAVIHQEPNLDAKVVKERMTTIARVASFFLLTTRSIWCRRYGTRQKLSQRLSILCTRPTWEQNVDDKNCVN
jgi:hypothetical protein